MAKGRLYCNATGSPPAKPAVGDRFGNLFSAIKSGTTTFWDSAYAAGNAEITRVKNLITYFDGMGNLAYDLPDAISVTPKAAIPSGYGYGVDIAGILASGKKYTVGVGILANRDASIYIGNQSRNYTYNKVNLNSIAASKNASKYFLFTINDDGSSVTPTATQYAYQPIDFGNKINIGAVHNIANGTDYTLRFLFALTSFAEAPSTTATENWQNSIGYFYRPICYESLNWFDFKAPWQVGETPYYVDVEYDATTRVISSVGEIETLDFVKPGISIITASYLNNLLTTLNNARLARSMPVLAVPSVTAGNTIGLSVLVNAINAATHGDNYIAYKNKFPTYETTSSGTNIVSSGSVILAEHINQVAQIMADTRDLLKCNSGCSGNCNANCSEVGCSSACTTGCEKSCSGTCSGNTCTNGCSRSCNITCYTSCNDTCVSSCSGGWDWGCPGCKDGCYGTCKGSCGSVCGGSCSNTCTEACNNSCNTTCAVICIVGCANVCTATCLDFCFNTCKNSSYSMSMRRNGSEVDGVVENTESFSSSGGGTMHSGE